MLAWNQVAMTRLNLGLKLGKCFHVFCCGHQTYNSSVLFFEKISFVKSNEYFLCLLVTWRFTMKELVISFDQLKEERNSISK